MVEHIAMDTATGELVYQLASIIISTIVGILGYYTKKYLKRLDDKTGYEFYNAKVERVLDNAIHFAEERAKHLAEERISKKELAYKYIEKISPDIIAKEGDKLEMMIDRKVLQVLNKK